MLLFCKPFTSKFSDFHNSFSKVNCLYLINDDYIVGASKVEKFDNDTVLLNLGLLKSNETSQLRFTGVTLEPPASSSLEDETAKTVATPPNFITECFFIAHLLINIMAKKIES